MTRTSLFVKPKIWLAITILTLGCLGPMYAGGAKEDPIDTAKQLIVQKQYDQAILILSNLISQDPQRMDEAEALLARVRSIKGDYNSLTQQFLDKILKEPDNYEGALAIIDKMQGLDPNPNQQSKDRIEGYRRLAKLTVDRTKKNRIMAQALARIEASDYLGAIDIYVTGFGLQRDEFTSSTLPDSLKNAVTAAVDQTQQQASVLRTEQGNLVPRLQAFESQAGSGTNGLQQATNGFSDMANEYLRALRQTLVVETAAGTISQLREQADQISPADDANEYIRFIQEFMNGPAKKQNEGIKAASRALIDSSYAGTLNSVAAIYQDRAKSVAAKTAESAYADAVKLIPELVLAGELLVRAQGLRGNKDLGQNTSVARIVSDLPTGFQIDSLRTQVQIDAYRQLSNALNALIVADGIKSSSTDQSLNQALVSFTDLATARNAWNTERDSLTKTNILSAKDFSDAEAVFVPVFDKARQVLIAYARNSFKAQNQAALLVVRTALTEQSARAASATQLLRGIETVEDQQKGVYKYPDRALAAFKAIADATAENIARLDAVDKRISGSQTELRDWPDMTPVKSDSADLRKRWSDFSTQVSRLSDEAQKNIAGAQERLKQAAVSVAQVKAAIDPAKLDLAAADSSYAKAREQYFSALDLQYDKTLRTQVFADLDKLAADIANARNIFNVAQVNKLITATETAFGKEDYNGALDSITQAETLYKQTNAYREDPNSSDPLIVYWKNRISARTNFSQERSLNEADAMFSTLSNYLNLAQIDYLSAKTAISSGDKTKASDLIARARTSLSNVTLVKPNNWDALTLLLRLDQLSDPEAFESRFKLRATEVMVSAKKTPSFQSLAEMDALLELKPTYPGLKKAQEQLRIDIGLDEDPGTVANRAKANGFVAQAAKLAQSRDQAQLRQALALTQQALTLIPNNKEARALADTLRIRIQGAVATLSFEDEQIYRRAEALYAAGDYGQALTLVNQLLANPKYKVLDQLIALRDRILNALN